MLGRLVLTRTALYRPTALTRKAAAPSAMLCGARKAVPFCGFQAINQTSVIARRFYRDEGAFGYRCPKAPPVIDYSPDELANRIQNSQLVRLVSAYRVHGHKTAELDPLAMEPKAEVPELNPARYGLVDPHQRFDLLGILHIQDAASATGRVEEATLDVIVAHLRQVYGAKIAFEFSHIPNSSERHWFQQAVESHHRQNLGVADKQRIGELLVRSEVFDQFMHSKFSNVRRYGLEGAEAMMVALDALFRDSNYAGVQDIVLCMAHRGRLNLLTDLLQLSPTVLFHKLRGNSEFPPDVPATGDVLSHLTSAADLDYGAKHPVHVSMLPNPSHLEAVNPVAMGKARAKQLGLFHKLGADAAGCDLGDRVMCVQLHGDAAFTGQGVVMETLGLSNLPHFTSGGSVHIIVNNQLGYTTPAVNARSTVYTSDIGKMVNAPVIHVNGDHPEEVARATQLALAYRMKFKKDVILDLLTFRRWGHNELDEPAYTQPLMYKNIRARASVPQQYEHKLQAEQTPASTEVLKHLAQVRANHKAHLDHHLQAAALYQPPPVVLQKNWAGMTVPTAMAEHVPTGVGTDVLQAVGEASVRYPEGMTVHSRLEKYHIKARLRRLHQGTDIDWATAEDLAVGSLLLEGHNARISGQDVGRGTFSQRHVMLVCQNTERVYIPLNHMANPTQQGQLEVANSHLSEMAVLGFEYGITLNSPHNLVIWEAQYGDFFNTAQVIIDTFITSGNTKWLRQSGLVMLLPHGYIGGGPEHSSCRIERFLQLSNDPMHYDWAAAPPLNPNFHFVNCTTPAQYFHVLRRQMKRNYRKPLIVASPKSLLRSPQCVSPLTDMAPDTEFQPVLVDPVIEASAHGGERVTRVLLVSGQIYYDLVKQRAQVLSQEALDTVAIVRVEEIAPFPRAALATELTKFPNAQEFIWCQEETENSGAYVFVRPRLEQILASRDVPLHYVGRPPLATSVTGIATVFKQEAEKILAEAFGPLA
ncbi:hypothetical protein H4R34_001127 [Dimargaris verticillata]|uniref:Transketolase-like pyrimidine-binding domain-containing protein n=1 Tax=Dimargaris verticillata TaxID=2761393 RepID=A0A9W8EE33_9FUNG|nr:hypothetical protein H4R34_001127 [Dimargaris verticillata]